MPADADKRRSQIRSFMKSRGLQAKPWARSAGIAPATLSNFIHERTNSLTQRSLERLAKAADATVAELIGERPVHPRAGRDVVTIEGLDIQAALGHGSDGFSEEAPGEPFYFRRNFIDRVTRGRPAQLRVIELTGDSMRPTLHDGDVALVDLGSTNPVQAPGIYCVFTGTGLAVKRVTAMPGARPKLRVQSDNPIYGIDEVDADEVRIIGRVVWRGGMV